MSKSTEKTIGVFILLCGVAIYSVTVFAYMHDKFTSKFTMTLIIKQLDRIEGQVDNINQRTIENVRRSKNTKIIDRAGN